MPSLFKSGSDLMSQGQDYVRRGQLDKATLAFEAAAAKCSKSGDRVNAHTAHTYSLFLRLGPGPSPPAALRQAATALRTLESSHFTPGGRTVSAASLANQLELEATDIEVESGFARGTVRPEDRAQTLRFLSEEYRKIGEEVVYRREFFGQGVVQASRLVPCFAARAEESLAMGLMASNPMAAAEHFQAAQQWWIQSGDPGRAQAAAQRVEQLAFRARCWYCGREGSGYGVQFVSMPVDAEISGLKLDGPAPLPSMDGSGRFLFVCKGCNSAMRLLSDSIAREHAEEVERHLLSRIEMIELRIRRLSP